MTSKSEFINTDIIKIESSQNESVNDKIFCELRKQGKIELINHEDSDKKTLMLNEGIFVDESIEQINAT